MTPRQRLVLFLAGAAGLVACYLWAFAGLPGFGHYPGPYGPAILHRTIAQTNATASCRPSTSTTAASTRWARSSSCSPPPPGWPWSCACCAASGSGPIAVLGWWLASHAQTNPPGGFQGGVVLATAFVLLYLSGEFLTFRRLSPVSVLDAVEAVGAAGFAAVGVTAVAMGLPYLYDFLPLGWARPGASARVADRSERRSPHWPDRAADAGAPVMSSVLTN